MKEDKFNPLKNLSKVEKTKCREIIIALVLATDLKLHFDIVAEFKNEIAAIGLEDESGKSGNSEEEEAMNLMAMKMAIKCSDIGHPTKIAPLHLKWSKLIMREFYTQGDEERKRKQSISPLCDRKDKHSVPGSQKGFINFLVQPVYSLWTQYLTKHVNANENSVKIFAENMKNNLAHWESWADEPGFDALKTTQIESDYDDLLKLEEKRYDSSSTASSVSTRNMTSSFSESRDTNR